MFYRSESTCDSDRLASRFRSVKRLRLGPVRGTDQSSKEYKKSNHRDKAKRYGLKKFLSELRIDHELTDKEKFELYYDEYRSLKKEEGSKSIVS